MAELFKLPPKPAVKRTAILLRLDDDLDAILRDSARRNCRSLTQEVRFRLLRDLEINDGR